MKITKKRQKVHIDTSKYVSPGKGVSTTELISNPTANDETWSTLEEEEICQEISGQPPPRLLINLIRKDISKRQEIYLQMVEIEKYLLNPIKKLSILNEPILFFNYEENKKAIVKNIKASSKEIHDKIQSENPKLIQSIINNESFVTENLESIFNEKLLKINKVPISKTESKKLARGFLLAFKLFVNPEKEPDKSKKNQ
jgi:hypothetical protein